MASSFTDLFAVLYFAQHGFLQSAAQAFLAQHGFLQPAAQAFLAGALHVPQQLFLTSVLHVPQHLSEAFFGVMHPTATRATAATIANTRLIFFSIFCFPSPQDRNTPRARPVCILLDIYAVSIRSERFAWSRFEQGVRCRVSGLSGDDAKGTKKGTARRLRRWTQMRKKREGKCGENRPAGIPAERLSPRCSPAADRSRWGHKARRGRHALPPFAERVFFFLSILPDLRPSA